MIDSHCHLADQVFAPDLEQVVDRSRAAGVRHVLCILAAGDEAEAAQAGRLRELWPDARFAVGVHPHQAAEFVSRNDDVGGALQEAISRDPLVRAIGEVGLDYHYDFSPRDVQQRVFREQVRVSRELRLPIVIHTREAEADTFAILEEEGGGSVSGIFHCFTGGAEAARRALDLGFHLSFAGIITFPRASDLREVARTVPGNRLLAETDSPFLAPVPHRGKRNEPAFVVQVIEALAALRQEPVDVCSAALTETYCALLRP